MNGSGVQDTNNREDSDIWSEWLLHNRHGGNAQHEQDVRAYMTKSADRVLDGVHLAPGMRLVDIGTGDGVVAFRAIERAGASLSVTMTDISGPMLRHAEALAVDRGIRRQCRFVQCSAERLDYIEDASVDAVTMRAALAYVADKPAAVREFHRILKPGGRISMAEPVLRDEALEVCALKQMVDGRPAASGDLFFPLLLRWRAAQFPDTEEKLRRIPITNYGERDLVRLAIDTGFADIHLELHIDVRTTDSTCWETFIHASPHPLAKPLKVILEENFTADERRFFESRLRPIVESGRQFGASRVAYLTAQKPTAS